MSNIISLHKRQVFSAAGVPADFAKAYFYESGTTTQVSVYSDADLLVEHAQPVTADADGVLPPCYVGSSAALRILITDQDDVPLAGYPMDDITPETTDVAGASSVTFEPTSTVPATNVQAAIEAVDERITDQANTYERPFKVFSTGGTGNDFTVTPSPAITAYRSGQAFLVRPDRNNTGATTFNFNGLGARALRKSNQSGVMVDLGARDIQAGREFWVVDNGSTFEAIFLSANPSRSGDTNNGYERWFDGRQVCYITLSGRGPVTTALGTLFASANINPGTWPVNFATGTTPSITYNVWRTGGASEPTTIWEYEGPTATASARIVIVRAVSAGATDFVIRVQAEGRWYV